MDLEKKRDYFSLIFDIGMVWRVIYGILKLILGIFLLNFVHSSFSDLFYSLVGDKLIEDPNDILMRTIGSILDKGQVDVSYFVAFYFIFWGSLDAFLSINILRLKIWAYPISLFLITIFTIYEVYRFAHTHSMILFAVILFDIFIIWLINEEYNKLRKPSC